MSIPATLQRSVVRGRVGVDIALVIGASAIIAIAAQIAIPVPFSPVPLTMQPLAVLLVGAILGSQRSAAAATLYLLEGLSGLPVFAQGHGGPLWLAGPTAGYLYSYPFAAFVAGRFARPLLAMLLGLVVIYIGGWSWLTQFVGPRQAFAVGVAPFVIADIIKILLGAAALPFVERALGRLTTDN